MKSLVLVGALLCPALAIAQQPVTITGPALVALQAIASARDDTADANKSLLVDASGLAISASNPQSVKICQASGTGCIDVPTAVTENYHTAGTELVQIFGMAIPGASGAVKVSSTDPFPTYFPTAQPVAVSTIGGLAPVYNPCDDPVKITWLNINLAAGADDTEHVALDGSDRIWLCGYSFQMGGAAELTLHFGTGASCDTGATNIRTITAAAASGGQSLELLTPVRSAAGAAFCTERSASVTLEGGIFYVQEP